MGDFRDAGASFFNRLKGNVTESKEHWLNQPPNASVSVSVNGNHAASRLYKAIMERRDAEGDNLRPVTENKPPLKVKEIISGASFACPVCESKMKMPSEGNDKMCKCGRVYPYAAAKALHESQSK